ncbi:MAG: CsgG/HfaB family protein, partial [Clostridiales bacterium]
MMISDFSQASRFAVVERNKLEEVLKELKLGQTRSFDSATTARIGKLLGAEYLVFGSYFEFLGRFRIDARVVKVETGQVVASVGAAGKVDEFELLEKKIVSDLHTKMKLPLPST